MDVGPPYRYCDDPFRVGTGVFTDDTFPFLILMGIATKDGT